MKKNIIASIFILAAAVCVNAADLRNFSVLLQAGDFIAGSAIPVTITAYGTDNAVKTDYTGNVTATASVGDAVFENPEPRLQRRLPQVNGWENKTDGCRRCAYNYFSGCFRRYGNGG